MTFSPFIHWGDFKSEQPSKPDVLILQVVDPEIQENSFCSYVPVLHNDNGEWKEKNLPLKQHDHWNRKLFKKYYEMFNSGLISINTHLRLITWKRKSKRSEYMVRDFDLDCLD